jgi:leucyl-tRNA synthetase
VLISVVTGNRAVLKTTGEELDISFEKMSKSKYNGVDPIVSLLLLIDFHELTRSQSVIEQFGADTIRLFLLFKAPVDNVVEWDTQAIQGQYRWLNRVWNLIQLQKVTGLLKAVSLRTSHHNINIHCHRPILQWN